MSSVSSVGTRLGQQHDSQGRAVGLGLLVSELAIWSGRRSGQSLMRTLWRWVMRGCRRARILIREKDAAVERRTKYDQSRGFVVAGWVVVMDGLSQESVTGSVTVGCEVSMCRRRRFPSRGSEDCCDRTGLRVSREPIRSMEG